VVTTADTETDRAKQAIRERVWALLDAEGAVQPPGAHGHIPSFTGADQAAERLAALPAWQAAQVIKVNPDKAQRPVRARALADGKTVYMAVPRLATEKPFYLLDPAALPVPPGEASAKETAARIAPQITLSEMRPVDLVVSGSVAVNREGVRLGKGAGYSDIEVALLTEAGLLRPETVIVTTVHTLQVLDEPLPETEHDFSVDLIVTPNQVIECGPARRPVGLYWDHLDPSKIAAIPVLATQAAADH
jgi:5-formyltetrahydrofolate cyclo-ligase